MTTHPTRVRWHPTALWLLLHEPRVITALHLVGYLILTAGGTLALISPPSSIQAEWGPLLTSLWGGALLIGGAIALVSTPRGVWWGERIGITILIVGLLMYASIAVFLHVTASGNRLPQVGVIAYAIVSLLVRWIRIKATALDPMRGPDGYRPDPAV